MHGSKITTVQAAAKHVELRSFFRVSDSVASAVHISYIFCVIDWAFTTGWKYHLQYIV